MLEEIINSHIFYHYQFRTYAPVTSHEYVSILMAYAAQHALNDGGGDVDISYLYGKIDFNLVM